MYAPGLDIGKIALLVKQEKNNNLVFLQSINRASGIIENRKSKNRPLFPIPQIFGKVIKLIKYLCKVGLFCF